MITQVQGAALTSSQQVTIQSFERDRRVHETALNQLKVGVGLYVSSMLLNAFSLLLKGVDNTPDSAKIILSVLACTTTIVSAGLFCHAYPIFLGRTPCQLFSRTYTV